VFFNLRYNVLYIEDVFLPRCDYEKLHDS